MPPAIFQAAVEACVEKRQGRTYGPPPGRLLTLFLDDLSMPALNEWGDQPTAEAVRQLLEAGGLYSTDKPVGEMKTFVDTRVVAAMRCPTGGANDVPNRLKRQFAIFAVPAPSPAVLGGVFSPLVSARFDAALCGPDVAATAAALVPATVALAARLAARLLPTPAKVHYRFSMHELAQVFAGLLVAARDRFSLPAPGSGGGPGGRGPPDGDAPAGTPACPPQLTSPAAYVAALWTHECARVFGDRMTTAEDAGVVDAAIRDAGAAVIWPDLAASVFAAPIAFVDFLREPERNP
jgi:dynein heavy chain, axonemal